MARKRVAPALWPSSTAASGPLVRGSIRAKRMATSWRCGEFSGDDAVDSKGTEERGGGGKEEGGKSRHSLTDEGGEGVLFNRTEVEVGERGIDLSEGGTEGTGARMPWKWAFWRMWLKLRARPWDRMGRVADGDEAEDGGRRTAA